MTRRTFLVGAVLLLLFTLGPIPGGAQTPTGPYSILPFATAPAGASQPDSIALSLDGKFVFVG